MLVPRLALVAPVFLLASASAAMSMSMPVDPLRFFVGRTESVGRVKVMFQKNYATHSTGVGRIEPDGSLILSSRCSTTASRRTSAAGKSGKSPRAATPAR